MNKELIKTYKAEFNHWLNDKEVLACPIKNKLNGYAVDWQPIDENALWDNKNIAYIINDKYVEFRKALAEGKTVEVALDHNDIDGYIWKSIEDDEFHHFNIDEIRIKPEDLPKKILGNE